MNLGFEPSGRVVVTGLGAVTPLGTGIDTFWPRMLAGENGIGPVTCFDVSEYSTRIGAEVKDFQMEDWLDARDARRMDRVLGFSVAAARMALEMAGFPLDDEEVKLETGVMIGSGIGGLSVMSEQTKNLFTKGPSRVSPFLVPYMIPDMCSGLTSILFGLKGPNSCVVTACATGVNAIGDAYHIIKRGDAVAMVAGGAEAPITPIGMSGFSSMRAMSTRNDDPARASRPFDKDRDGFVIGEGAGVLILEDLALAQKRGAKILAEIVGYGMSGDAYHITATDPNGDGARRAMTKALKSAGMQPEDIGYINAHGTSTPYNDPSETKAIKSVFGEAAYGIPVSSTKSSIGHLLGGAGAVETVICLLALRDGKVPPTINLETPDPECDLDYVPNASRDHAFKAALTNSFGFGGHNASLIVKAF
ncbi:MAG: beta-ketoacyl-ACP synthase II [Fimbriimonadaceae bacterium]|nr:beta-ketoacyl-ACP synthase II [Fimbriimonadaceae bacterium]